MKSKRTGETKRRKMKGNLGGGLVEGEEEEEEMKVVGEAILLEGTGMRVTEVNGS